MKNILTPIFLIAILTGCTPSSRQTDESNSRIELIPEPDKAERLKYEAIVNLRNSGCSFIDPDTSLSNIKIRDSESTIALIGDQIQPDSFGLYHFYSLLDRELLTLTQHPGDNKKQISIFKVEYADKADYGFRQLPIDTFMTEKGIKLGMNKDQIIKHLGSCYAALDSNSNYIELRYMIESPNDSRTRVLKTHNMPFYYASYKLLNDRLEQFEFGFAYP